MTCISTFAGVNSCYYYCCSLYFIPGTTRNVAKLATAVITLREARWVSCKQVVIAFASCFDDDDVLCLLLRSFRS